MLLTQTAEYALRVMAHLARQAPDDAQRAADLSLATGIPVAYLSKILRRLVVAGLLESQKGHGGGFVLARKAAQIRFADILAAAEYEPDPARCAFGWGDCDPADPCPLHPAWARLKDAHAKWAGTTTLAEAAGASPPRGRTAASARRAKAAGPAPTPRKGTV